MRKIALLFFFSLAGCDFSVNGSACEEARTVMQNLIEDSCQSAEYRNTPFCTCCVELGYHSVDGACGCRDLVFDADACLYSNGDEGKPAVRFAIEKANSECAEKRFGIESADRLPEATSRGSYEQVCRIGSDAGASTGGGGGGTGGTGGGGTGGTAGAGGDTATTATTTGGT